MKVQTLRHKIEARLRLVEMPIDPAYTLSVISDRLMPLLRSTFNNIEEQTITTVASTGVYQIGGSMTYAPFRIDHITWPTEWTARIDYATRALLDEYKQRESNDEFESYDDQPQLFTYYNDKGGTRWLELFKAGNVAAGLTITASVSTIYDELMVADGDDLPIQPGEFDELFYSCLEEMIDPEKHPRLWQKYSVAREKAHQQRMRDEARPANNVVQTVNVRPW